MKFKQFTENVKVGVVGFSDESYIASEDQVKAYFRQGLKDLGIEDSNITIVSGLTNMGVPKLCYEEAVRLKMKTVGITAEEAKKYDLFPCDETFFVGENFGDESEFFLTYIDYLIKIGGGKQSIKEFKQFTGPKVEYSLDGGTFAGIRLTEESNKQIIDLCKQLKLKDHVNKSDIHITLLYSRKLLPEYVPVKVNEQVTVDKFKIFTFKDDKQCLVLTLKNGYCQKRHKELMELHDATYDFPTYIPHITLSTDYRNESDLDIKQFEPLTLETEYIEDLKL